MRFSGTMADFTAYLFQRIGQGEQVRLAGRAHQGQLRDIMTYCRGHGVILRVILLPFIRTSGDAFDSETIHGRVGQFLVTEGIEVLDLLPTIAGRDPADLVVNPRDAHPNELAHSLFAEAIRQAFYARSSP